MICDGFYKELLLFVSHAGQLFAYCITSENYVRKAAYKVPELQGHNVS